MKRDMDLVRKILLAVEALPPNPDLEPLHVEGYADDVVDAHLVLMADAGLVEVIDTSTLVQIEHCPQALTWSGSELLDAVRDDQRWRQAKDFLRQVGGASLPVIVGKLMEWAAQQIH